MEKEDEKRCNMLQLPTEIIEKVFSLCKYDAVSNLRLVCKVFDQCGQVTLNQGFSKVDKYHLKIQKLVKGKLPRRESERRNHPLAKHVNALSAIETRLSLLNMTYVKYIDMGVCCFIPGKVLDEMFAVLHALEDTSTQPRTHELLQELRDISSMAMEHFDEKIVPLLKKCMSLSTTLPIPSTSLTPANGYLNDIQSLSWSTPQLNHARQPVIRQEINQIRSGLRAANSTVLALRKDVSGCRTGTLDQTKKWLDLQKKLYDQNKIISEQNARLSNQDQRIQELNQSVVEYDHKFNELFTEIARMKCELGMEASVKTTKSLAQDNQSKVGSCSSNLYDNTVNDNVNVSRKRKSKFGAKNDNCDDMLPKRTCVKTVCTRSSASDQ